MTAAGRIALASASLWWREQVRFVRQASRLIGALATPLLFWLLIGSGVGSTFQLDHAGSRQTYLEYFFPGALVLILLFTSIFSTISVIEDRREGFLQGVLVAPVPRACVVLGKVLGGTTLALLQGAVFFAVAPLAGLRLGPLRVLAALPAICLVAFWLTALGFAIAWVLDSIQGFHVVMNLFLIPMWLLSGALFPPGGAARWLRWLMWANPLTYGVAAVRRAISGDFGPGGLASTPGYAVSMALMVALAALSLWIASLVASRSARSVA